MKKKDVEAVRITDMGSAGKALSRIDNQVVFVDGAVPGDVADISIIRKKKSFLQAVVKEYHELSEDRIDPVCNYFGICGGCKWQHINYERQLQFKQKQVEDNLTRIGKVEIPKINPILPSDHSLHYRNKLEFTFTNHRWLTQEEINSGVEIDRNGVGFHVPGFYDRIVDIEECHLQIDISNEIRNRVREFAMKRGYSFFNVKKNEGLLRNLIIRTSSTGEVMVLLQVSMEDIGPIEEVMADLHDKFPQITSSHYIINLKKNDDYSDQEVIHYGGNPTITEQMKDPNTGKPIVYQISPKSFYQTNSSQAENLYHLAWEFGEFNGDERVYDLYTGTGTIASYIASSVESVVGIEYVEDAVKDARINAELNGIENAKFFSGDMKDVLSDEFVRREGSPDVIITDPPRAGMHKDVTLKLLEVNPRKIIYISCNPATQARDLELLSERYIVTNVQPVDMFPHTPHVENIVVLERRN